MKLTIKTLFLLLIMAADLFGLATSSVLAGDRPNLLIMAEDADRDSLPRDSRVVKRVLNALAIQLQDIGFEVYDESVISLDTFSQRSVRRDRQELMAIGQSVRHPPIDVVVSFTIYASLLDKGYINQVNTRIEAQMVQINSGRFLGSFEVSSPKAWTAPAYCDHECVLEVVGSYAKILASDLGSVLAEKLVFLLDGTIEGAFVADRSQFNADGSQSNADGAVHNDFIGSYHLIFDNFSPEAVMAMEEYLVVFSGYQSHRPTYSSARRAELWYQSDSKSGRLQRNLIKMLDRLGLHARVTYSGNTFNIEQTVIVARKAMLDGDQW